MMRSLFSGVSGLKGHQTRMDVIGNNIANVNATGFKSSRVTFADTLSQTQTAASAPGDTLGGTNPKQIGLGTGVASIDLLFTDGSAQQTGKNTDVALSGNGLFVVKSGKDTYYTRDGAFEFDADGNYVLPGSGHYVQGWMAKDGVLTTNGGIENIVVKAGKSMAAKASEKITYENNLNSAALTISKISGGNGTIQAADVSASNPVTLDINGTTYTVTGITSNIDTSATWTVNAAVAAGGTTITITDGTNPAVTCTLSTATTAAIPASTSVNSVSGPLKSSTASTTKPVTLTMSDGSTVTQTSGTYTTGYSLPITTTVNVYDTLGNVHTLNLFFTKTKVSSSTGNEWTLSLDSDITKTSTTITETDGSTTTLTLKPVTINFTTSGKYNSGTGSTTLTLTNGALGTQSVAIDLSTLTQYAGSNTVKGEANGNAAGTLKSVSIDQSGIITGVYTNGVRQSEAQIAIAQFSNASGLTKTGSSLYQESNNSGTANVKTAADLGVSITPSALEMSNVDIANEFSDMIITQRGFQSNSKVITVGDEMLETLINMKR
ncbi:flagellar hook protein FlgE [Selenomonas ruminantium]|uniref:flagellar hook protein FlgE n=1 Tax=Selenomonas ruminantium TaxID=971 RepID=UPI00047B22F6|nr:flagellar hook protein FlgE [Selenomonas ruminantium]